MPIKINCPKCCWHWEHETPEERFERSIKEARLEKVKAAAASLTLESFSKGLSGTRGWFTLWDINRKLIETKQFSTCEEFIQFMGKHIAQGNPCSEGISTSAMIFRYIPNPSKW